MFQVLVVGGYNTPKMLVIKFLEYGLGYGTAYLVMGAMTFIAALLAPIMLKNMNR